jgi:hypothetical protein
MGKTARRYVCAFVSAVRESVSLGLAFFVLFLTLATLSVGIKTLLGSVSVDRAVEATAGLLAPFVALSILGGIPLAAMHGWLKGFNGCRND